MPRGRQYFADFYGATSPLAIIMPFILADWPVNSLALRQHIASLKIAAIPFTFTRRRLMYRKYYVAIKIKNADRSEPGHAYDIFKIGHFSKFRHDVIN